MSKVHYMYENVIVKPILYNCYILISKKKEREKKKKREKIESIKR
jgi:hypothetical protein